MQIYDLAHNKLLGHNPDLFSFLYDQDFNTDIKDIKTFHIQLQILKTHLANSQCFFKWERTGKPFPRLFPQTLFISIVNIDMQYGFEMSS